MSEICMDSRSEKEVLQRTQFDTALLLNDCEAPEQNVQSLASPAELLDRLPATAVSAKCVETARKDIQAILAGKDQRLIVIVGPCSIHDYESALDYARRLRKLSLQLSGQLCLVMRCYFEKPRTALGWKGLINDPDLDGSCDIAAGIALVRRILLDITALGVPVATETLEPNLANYYQDLISWTAIGARTAESQLHRQFASGLSSPVGIKNATNGCIEAAVNGLLTVRSEHCFAGIDRHGRMSAITTAGNQSSHIILRGGKSGSNYDPDSIEHCKKMLAQANIEARIVVDCSHANSGKNASNQSKVVENLLVQFSQGEKAIAGLMLESHINPGNQALSITPELMDYGVSITDECIGWETTEALLRTLDTALSER